MADKLRHWKERDGRYSVRISIPERLRPHLENLRTSGNLKFSSAAINASRKHSLADVALTRQIRIAQAKYEAATGEQPKAPSYPLIAQQIVLRDYES